MWKSTLAVLTITSQFQQRFYTPWNSALARKLLSWSSRCEALVSSWFHSAGWSHSRVKPVKLQSVPLLLIEPVRARIKSLKMVLNSCCSYYRPQQGVILKLFLGNKHSPGKELEVKQINSCFIDYVSSLRSGEGRFSVYYPGSMKPKFTSLPRSPSSHVWDHLFKTNG